MTWSAPTGASLPSTAMASFDRRKCVGPLNGPQAIGQHCPEGWSVHTEPLPQFKNLDRSGSSEGSYFTWVDQFNALGLRENIPINTGNQSDASLLQIGNVDLMLEGIEEPRASG